MFGMKVDRMFGRACAKAFLRFFIFKISGCSEHKIIDIRNRKE
jgi:hypothetical protein